MADGFSCRSKFRMDRRLLRLVRRVLDDGILFDLLHFDGEFRVALRRSGRLLFILGGCLLFVVAYSIAVILL